MNTYDTEENDFDPQELIDSGLDQLIDTIDTYKGLRANPLYDRELLRDALDKLTEVAHFHRADGSHDKCVPCHARAALDGEA